LTSRELRDRVNDAAAEEVGVLQDCPDRERGRAPLVCLRWCGIAKQDGLGLQQVARGRVKQQLCADSFGVAMRDCHRDPAASEAIALSAKELDAGESSEHPEKSSAQLRRRWEEQKLRDRPKQSGRIGP
jgi:hypothetical protein